MKIAFLIPTTSKGKNWKNAEDCLLISTLFRTLNTTCTEELKINDIHLYIGIDKDDSFYSQEKNVDCINRYFSEKKIQNHWTIFDNSIKGHLTIMWNILYKKAYEDGCDYFYQCGDDIEFTTSGWLSQSIIALQKNNNVGVSGPKNRSENDLLLTQALVSRKHMDIFGFLFPPLIKNWYCDNWLSEVYQPSCFFLLSHHLAKNIGGAERYPIDHDKTPYLKALESGKNLLRSLYPSLDFTIPIISSNKKMFFPTIKKPLNFLKK